MSARRIPGGLRKPCSSVRKWMAWHSGVLRPCQTSRPVLPEQHRVGDVVADRVMDPVIPEPRDPCGPDDARHVAESRRDQDRAEDRHQPDRERPPHPTRAKGHRRDPKPDDGRDQAEFQVEESVMPRVPARRPDQRPDPPGEHRRPEHRDEPGPRPRGRRPFSFVPNRNRHRARLRLPIRSETGRGLCAEAVARQDRSYGAPRFRGFEKRAWPGEPAHAQTPYRGPGDQSPVLSIEKV